jgi:hypothetical protein
MSKRLLFKVLQQQSRSPRRQHLSVAFGKRPPLSPSQCPPSSSLKDHLSIQTSRPLISETQRCWFATEVVSQDDDTTNKNKATPENENQHVVLKKKQQLKIQLMQLRNLHPKDTIEEHYEKMARRTELSKFKWIQTLERQLEAKTVEDGDAWKQTQWHLDRKSSMPQNVKDGFWNLILAPTGKKKKTTISHHVPAEDVQIFQRARDLSVDFPFFWSKGRKRKVLKTVRQQKETTQDYLALRTETISNLHRSKSITEQEEEAKQLTETLHERLPTKYYDKVVDLFRVYIQACESEQADLLESENTEGDEAADEASVVSNISESDNDQNSVDIQKPKKRIKMLFSNLKAQAQTHVHLISSDLADFLYINVSVSSDASEREDVAAVDPRIIASQKAWNDAKEHFVVSFQSVQTILTEEYAEKAAMLEAEENDKNFDENGEDGKDIADGSEESIMKSFQDAAGAPNNQASTQRIKPRSYVIFEAISIGDWATTHGGQALPEASVEGTPLEDACFASSAPNDRLVFIDNLPIDISENRLLEAYSRCGDIESLQVFHRRADLDPGRRLDDSRKKIRNPSSSRQKWQRPRTPLYAMILYRDAAGATKAVADPLRIFGMVLDKHLIRSFRPSDMTKLYLEDISAAHDVTSIEYQLSQLLHPELYVCLDIGRRQGRTFGSSSCEIKFPNFEAAYWAYLKLSAQLDLLKEDGCALHWMQTPRDAMHFWTRQLNF